jgi:hypothetical protein
MSAEEKGVAYIGLAVEGERCNLESYPIRKVPWFTRNCGKKGDAEEQRGKVPVFDQSVSVYTGDILGGCSMAKVL